MSQFTQPQQPFTPAQMPGVPSARNGVGTAALVLGIIGCVSGLIPFFFWMAGILGLIALILGLVGRGRAKRGEATNKGVTTFGAVLGLLALILSVVGAVITFKVVDDAVDKINESAPAGSAPKEPGAAKDTPAPEKTEEAPAEEPTGEALEERDTAVYDDGLEITVGNAAAYTPDAYAAGHTKGNRAYKVSVIVENKTEEKFDAVLVSVDARAGEDGVSAEQIFDGKVGEGFTGTVLPGKKVTVQFAFDTPADARNLTVEVSPGLEWDASQWELKL